MLRNAWWTLAVHNFLARSLMGAVLCATALTNQSGYADEDVSPARPLPGTPAAFAEDLSADQLDAVEDRFSDLSFTGPPVGGLRPFKKPPSWGQVDFLLMWRRQPALPPLVTTSPPGTPLAQAGQLSQPTTTTLLGGQSQVSGPSTGGRIDFGYWLNACSQLGVGGSFLALGNSSLDYAIDTTTTPILARPFFNVTDGQTAAMDTLLASFPDEASGEIAVQATSTLIVAEAYLRQAGQHGAGTPGDLVGGYQFSRIDGSLKISSHSTALSTSQLRVPGTTLSLFDSINTQNEFHGGQLGVLNDWHYGCFTIFGSFKLGLGNMRQKAALSGQTVIDDSVNSITDPQGLLIRNTNIGNYERNVITVVPQVNLRGTYAVSHQLDVTIGYSLIFFPHVLQPAEQLDPDLAVNLAASGEPRPQFTFQSRDYWAQGLTFGLRWNY
ncbi:MAG: hypothetical protein CMJ75_11860 [Planctomycetaceae bacterium]|nr:hypothetical protein [Planctomycetaceae bacterium]